MGTGVRIATGAVRPRNDRVFTGSTGKCPAGGQGRPPLRRCVTKKSVGEGLCPSRGRGNRRSAAGGGCSEPVSRKCPDWRTRQWPGIGWHDGGQENPAPTEAQQEVQWAGDRKGRPYGSVYKECDFYRAGRCGERTERCQWQRKRSERVAAVKILSVRRKAAQKFWAPQQGHRPLRGEFGENKRKSKRIPKYPLAFDRSEELEVLDDVNDFGTDALLSLHGGGADVSGRLENVPVAHF